jgi:hypothetical protein
VIFFETYSIFFASRVFELPLPRNAQKRTKKKKRKVRTYFFLRAGADVRRFLVLFFRPPLGYKPQATGVGRPKKKWEKKQPMYVRTLFGQD